MFIYGLCGSDGAIRYIGQTKRLKERLAHHVTSARYGRSHKDRWVLLHHKAGDLRIVEMFRTDNSNEDERAAIAYGYDMGWRLLNIQLGGQDASAFQRLVLRERWRKSKHRALMAVGCQIMEEARRNGDMESYARFRVLINTVVKNAKRIKREIGEEAFQEWANRIYGHLPVGKHPGMA